MLPVQWMQETESAYTRHNYTRYFVDLDGSRFTMSRQRRRHLHAYTLTVMGGSEITVHLDERERVKKVERTGDCEYLFSHGAELKSAQGLPPHWYGVLSRMLSE